MSSHAPTFIAPLPGFRLRYTLRGHTATITDMAWTPDGHMLITIGLDNSLRFWSPLTGEEVRQFRGAGNGFRALALVSNSVHAVLAPADSNNPLVMDTISGMQLITLCGHHDIVNALAVTTDGKRLVSASQDHKLKVWALESGIKETTLYGHTSAVTAVVITPDNKQVVSADSDGVIYVWDIDSGRQVRYWTGHQGRITALAISADGSILASASEDCTVRLWQINTAHLLNILEGHLTAVVGVTFSPGGRLLTSRGADQSLRLWRTDTWEPLAHLDYPAAQVSASHGMAFSPTAPMLAALGENDTAVHLWDIDYRALFYSTADVHSIRYTTAKVALVGDSGVGKTGLGFRMTQGHFRETLSTHGQQFWVMDRLKRTRYDGVEQEVVVWDFAGQPDYRLIHSLFLDDVDVVLLLFDAADRIEPLKGVEYWLNQLQHRAEHKPVRKILVGARLDRGYPSLTEDELAAFCEYHNIEGGYIGTSAYEGTGIDELIARIEEQIEWDRMTATVTTTTFKRIKSFVLNLKADPFWKKVLVTPAELREMLTALDPTWEFSDAELNTAIRHLENHGYVMTLPGADMRQNILLMPDLLINLAASFVVTARANPRGLGALEEDKLLKGGYEFPELAGLTPTEQDILREAATMLLLEHHVCFREKSETNSLLIFPSLINQRRSYQKNLETYDDISYRVKGAVQNIYASMVVQLSYAQMITRAHHWQSQAQFQMGVGELCGFRLMDVDEGEVDLVLYFGAGTADYTRSIFRGLFEKFLKSKNVTVTRYPPVRCPNCEYQQERSIIVRRIEEGRDFLHCAQCGTLITYSKLATGEMAALPPHSLETLRREQVHTRLRTGYEKVLTKLKSMVRNAPRQPTCFISYAWGNELHEQWVERLVNYLREADIDVIWDRWHNPEVGHNLARFVSRIAEVDYIIVVGTPLYHQKYENKLSSTGSVVASEVDLINLRLMGTEEEKNTVLPVLLEGDERTSFPPLLQGRTYSDFRQERFYFSSLFNLILTMYHMPAQDPTIGELQAVMREEARKVN